MENQEHRKVLLVCYILQIIVPGLIDNLYKTASFIKSNLYVAYKPLNIHKRSFYFKVGRAIGHNFDIILEQANLKY